MVTNFSNKKTLFYSLFLSAIIFVSTNVYASTTISTNINTEGTLTVTGTSTLTGNVGVGTTDPLTKLYVTDSNTDIVTAKGTAVDRARLLIDAATAGADPMVSFLSETGSKWSIGVRYSNSYALQFAPSYRLNSPVMTILTSGNVGINTTSPAAFLHILTSTTAAGTTILEQLSTDTDAFDLNLRKARGNATTPTAITTGDELGIIKFNGYSGAGGYVTAAAIKSISEGTIATTRIPANLSFWTGTDVTPTVLTERMRIDSTGNVGIGTTTPQAKLHVTSGASATTTINIGELGSATSHACFNTKNTVGADISFYFVETTMVVENNTCR